MEPKLKGLKVLDFTYLLPGPYGTMMLADMGADIIKVENRANPDLMRAVPPFVDGVSAAYAHLNRGKRSLALDLKTPESREIVIRLVREYDIVVEQFRPGVMDRLGLGYDALRAANPRIIYCSLTGYGQSGSYADRAGHDINYLALSGIASYSGRADSGPTLNGIQIADVCGGSKNVAIGVLAAFIARERTGEGDRIDISITDSAFALTAFQAAGHLAGGPVPGPETDILNGAILYDYYRTADGRFLSVGPLEPKFFDAFRKAIAMEGELAGMDLSNIHDVKKAVALRIASKPLDEWMEAFSKVDACVEPVLTLAEAVSRPPVSERGMLVTVRTAAGSGLTQIGNPIRFASGDNCAGWAGTAPGRHTVEILRALGYDDDAIAQLRDCGAIDPAPTPGA
ncbi:MAG TPA: CaiB/BaiF CoA-transferase family protein [Spirochaetota bacterium]|nr:CaiB/BaiF CoA-transferase family protein [Spirochaetota bacterium]